MLCNKGTYGLRRHGTEVYVVNSLKMVRDSTRKQRQDQVEFLAPWLSTASLF